VSVTIIRKAHRSKYVVVDKAAAEDKEISAKALGWLLRVLAKPDDWSVSIRQFAREFGVGMDAVRTAFAELEQVGYILRIRYQTERGTFDWEYRVFEAKADAAEARLEIDGLVGEQRRSGGPRRPAGPGQPRSGNPNMDAPCWDSPYTDRPYTDRPYTENPTTTKEGLSKDCLTKDGPPNGAPAPDAQPDHPSLFEAQGLPDDSPESHGSPTPDGAPPPPPTVSQNGHSGKKADTAEIVQTVFGAWQQGANHPGAKLVEARRRKIKARSREGFTVDQLVCVVAEAWKYDPWPERVNNNDLVTLLRDGPQVERFLEMYRKARPATNGNGHHADPEEVARQAREFNARQAARQTAANTTPRGAQLAAELAAKGARQ
jgi:ASC-1-like (ASCH) protein